MLTKLETFAPGAPLHAMTAYKQFLLFKQGDWDVVKQKFAKVPHQADGSSMPWRADPSKLMTFDEAVKALAHFPKSSIGFVLSESDPFFCLDIDNCATYDAQGKHIGWSQQALDLVAMIPNGVVEVSMSGNGLHVFGTAIVDLHACDNNEVHAEFYTKWRAMAVSGNVSSYANAITNDCTFDVADLVEQYFYRSERTVRRDGEGASLADLEKAREACKFIDPALNYNDWIGNCMALHAAGVEADAEDTAFQIAQEYTALSSKYVPGYLEYKWSSFHADGGLTLGTLFHHAKAGGYKTREEIDAAAAFADFQAEQPVPMAPPCPTPPPPIAGGVSSGLPVPTVPAYDNRAVLEVEQHATGIKMPTDYLKEFGHFVYVASLHSIWTPQGEIHDQQRFDALFSGHQYALDQEGRKLVDSPWEAFFRCRIYKFKRATGTCFRPELPSGTPLTYQGRTVINTYYPIKVPRMAGDPTPFLEHLAKLLPNERDRRILLTYMAALVQNPGIKFRWAPLLQGDEGNGKTFCTSALEQAVGEAYTHYPNAQDLDNKFNSWQRNKLLIAVEDVHVPNHKANVIEALKPMITGTRVGLQGKGKDQVTESVCCNFIFNSNHRNALGAAVKGRRYCVFYTAQQKPEDLIRDGMGGKYFVKLYKWAETQGGYAIITDYLHTYALDAEFNPAGECVTAPKTSSYIEVMGEAAGPIEQELMAAIQEERAGFVSPWISSLAVDKLLTHTRMAERMPRAKRKALIESLGYERHPHLAQGRTNNAVLPDGGKTVLYVKSGHPVLELQNASKIAERYTEAQAGSVAKDAFENNNDEISK